MSLAPISPVSRRGQWRDHLRIVDKRTGELMNLVGYSFRMEIARADDREAGGFLDYGRRAYGGSPCAVLSIQSNDENTGPLILGDDYTLFFVFSRDQMLGLCPGSYVRSVLAFAGTECDEISRELFTLS